MANLGRFATRSEECVGGRSLDPEKRCNPKPPATEIEEVVQETFQGQREATDCTPACLKSAADELYERITAPADPHPVSYGDITDACGWSADMPLTELDVEGLKKEMDPLVGEASVLTQFSKSPGSDIDALQGVLGDDPSSYPIVVLGPNYFSGDEIPYRVRGVPETRHHSVVVVRLEEDSVEVYDPLARYKSPQDAPGEWLVTLPRVRFMNVWENEHFPRETFWFTIREGGLDVY